MYSINGVRLKLACRELLEIS